MGVEPAGVVQAVGEGTTQVSMGDRVTCTGFLNTPGACSTEHLIAAAMIKRGLTLAYFMRRIHPFKAGDTLLLLHAAAGGVGLIVSQWARPADPSTASTSTCWPRGARFISRAPRWPTA